MTPEKPTKRMHGMLTAIFDRGYGFLSVGPGKPSYFVLMRDVAPEHWRKGQLFSFVPAPPRPGTKAPRAVDLIVIGRAVAGREEQARHEPTEEAHPAGRSR